MKLIAAIAACAVLAVAGAYGHSAQAEDLPDTQALLAANTHPFSLSPDGSISGPGAELLRRETAKSQFFLFGEDHHDRDTPILAGAIYRMLRKDHGYDVLVVEQDPLAIEAINKAPLKGDETAIAGLVKRYETHLGFASDQDLRFLAQASAAGPVWGVEQAQGADRYLEELATLAPNAALKARTEALLAEARQKEKRASQGGFVHNDPTTLSRLEALQADFKAKPGSRADQLLSELVLTVRIYSYNRRGMEGEYVGLYNNTEREVLFKRHFSRRYREAGGLTRPIKAMFKFGAYHMYRGKSPTQAYTIGNFAHELAAFNGMEGYGVFVLAAGGYGTWEEIRKAPYAPLLPVEKPATPVVINLRPLKPYARPFRMKAPDADQWQVRDLLGGFDAIIILPNSAKASWDLTGFPVP